MGVAHRHELGVPFAGQPLDAHDVSRIEIEAIAPGGEIPHGMVGHDADVLSDSLPDRQPAGFAGIARCDMLEEGAVTLGSKSKPADGFPSAGQVASRDASAKADHAHR